jgi:cytosine/adenosine deaminase-related metal-dependent hydrolase
MSILIENCSVLDLTAHFGVRRGQHIAIEGDSITSIGSQRPQQPFDRVLDGSMLLAIPGLINAHTHSPENFTRATSDRLPLEPWLAHLFGMSGLFDKRDHYLTAMIGVIEMLKTGCTAVLDHLSMPPAPNFDAMDGAMEAYRDSGIRAGVAPLLRDQFYDIDLGQARGFRTMETFYARFNENMPTIADMMTMMETFFECWHNQADGRLRCWIGPSGVQWASVEFMQACLETARKCGGGMHMHLLETRAQDVTMREMYGKTAVAMLADEGLLGSDVTLPHSVWVTDKDIQRIADAGAVPIHNPSANLKLGSGLSPIRKMLDAGIIPALGADGAQSSDHQVMFGILHLAALIHNVTFPEPDKWISSREAVQMATEGGAAALMLSGRLGKLEPGYLADITLLDLRSPHLTPLNDAYHHLAFTEPGSSVHTVIINGDIVVDDGVITTFDEAAILEEVREVTKDRPHRQAIPDEVKVAMERFLAFQQDVVQNTPFEQD